jgi:hypothetical protein
MRGLTCFDPEHNDSPGYFSASPHHRNQIASNFQTSPQHQITQQQACQEGHTRTCKCGRKI